jgi:hypothetical protein
MSLDIFSDRVRQLAEQVRQTFRHPGADWPPLLIWAQDPDPAEVLLSDLRAVWLTPEDRAIFLGDTLPQALVKLKPGYAGLLFPDSAALDPLGLAPASSCGWLDDDPAAWEGLSLLVSDGEREELWEARIVRDELGPPELRPWVCRGAVRGHYERVLLTALPHS